MRNRVFLFGVWALLGSWAGWQGNLSGEEASKGPKARPNIVWITAEDMSADLGAYGQKLARTPVLDAFAKESARYTHAFSVAGVCSPSRSCLIMGVYPISAGTSHMRTVSFGGREYARLPQDWHLFPWYLKQAGYYCSNNRKEDYQVPTPKDTWHESSRKAHWKKRPKKEQPFFAVFNFMETHESRVSSVEKYEKALKQYPIEGRMDPEQAEVPPFHPNTAIFRKHWARYHDMVVTFDQFVDQKLKELQEAGLAEDTIVFIFSDHGAGFPRMKRWLYDSGMHVPLLVRIPEKFRQAGQGEPGSVVEDLVSFVDFGPTVLHLAGVELPEHMEGQPFLGAGDLTKREYVYAARGRMDERYDMVRAVRSERFKYLRNYSHFVPWYQYMNTPESSEMMVEIRSLAQQGKLDEHAGRYLQKKPIEELYDVQQDPHELKNLAGEAQYAEVLKTMRAEQARWSAQHHDLGVVPESLLEWATDEFGFVYQLDKRWSEVSLEKTYAFLQALADLAAQREESGNGAGADSSAAALAEVRKALESGDPVLMHWALLVLSQGSWGAEALEVFLPLVTDALKAEHRVLQLGAAWVVQVHFRGEDALLQESAEVVREGFGSENQWDRLWASILVDELGEKGRPFSEVLKEKGLEDANKYVVRVSNRALNQLHGTEHKVP